ncbi:Glycosyl hydrolase 5 family protein [Cardamine amara subsp. amara]|uniref:Glycosyl hydrolase 5 family protein n=1 Tax=Cardamine amara subsp. amara TaxID=228776 RepID=A0ABD1AM46_CARAN
MNGTKEPRGMFCFMIILFSLSSITTNMAYPLSTKSRWIIDEKGQRVKLACVNWPSHLQPVVAEGLSKQGVDEVAKKILEMGFNCVRLTWPLDLATNETLANNVTVRQSFQSLGLNDDISGFQKKNPSMIDLPLIEAYKKVVASLGKKNVMVILDNHVTKPGWCCGYNDGNGFFGDTFFDPATWISGLTKIATTFKGISNVVGMSLRNELRGPKQNVDDWFKYMQQGAEAVHEANSNVLVILSGLSYDADLSFVRSRPVNLTFTEKLVYELHRYSITNTHTWSSKNPNEACGEILKSIENGGGFNLRDFPVFLSEFGIDLRGKNVNDNRYIGCILGWAAENDVDWSIWTLQGSYYLREGVVGMSEYYGVLDSDWVSVRNQSFMQRLSLIQSPLQGPDPQHEVYNLVFHPLTGLCMLQSISDPTKVTLGLCNESQPWSYTPDNTLTLEDKSLCLENTGLKLSETCSSPNLSKWQTISASKMLLAAKSTNNTLCLDVDEANNLMASKCKCVKGEDSSCDPISQWFKIVKVSK